MSYDIFYRKQFIKVSDTEVIPFFEAGSSNCYDMGLGNRRVGRRSREWNNQKINNKIIVTNDEVLKYVSDYQDSLIKRGVEWNKEENCDTYTYNPNRFGYHASLSIKGCSTSNTTYAHFLNFYKYGIETAITIEELISNGVYIYLTVSSYNRDKLKDKGLEVKPNVIFDSTQHLIDSIKEFTEYYKEFPNCFYLDVCDWEMTSFLNKKVTKRMKKEKELTTLNGYYVIKCPNGGLLVKFTKYGYRYVDNLAYYSTLKIFKTEKQANAFLTKANRTGFNVLKCDGEITVRL